MTQISLIILCDCAQWLFSTPVQETIATCVTILPSLSGTNRFLKMDNRELELVCTKWGGSTDTQSNKVGSDLWIECKPNYEAVPDGSILKLLLLQTSVCCQKQYWQRYGTQLWWKCSREKCQKNICTGVISFPHPMENSEDKMLLKN